MLDRSGVSLTDGDMVPSKGDNADWKQMESQYGLQLTTLPADQSRWGLWSLSQGCPKIIGAWGEEMRWKRICSRWCPEMISCTGQVWWVTRARSLPSTALASRGVVKGSVVISAWDTRMISIKFSSAPESTSVNKGSFSNFQHTCSLKLHTWDRRRGYFTHQFILLTFTDLD